MPDVAQLLQTLHPMREPPPPSPVAPYLAMLAAGIALAVIGAVAWRRLRRRGAGLRRSAERALEATRGLAPADRLAGQAQVLRRIVRVSGGEAAARSHGDAWLAALDATFTTTFFSAGEGRAYADALYRRQGAGDVEALDRSLAALFAKLGRTRRVENAAS